MGSYYDWKKAESPSLQCCDDGDCGSSKCGFAWLQGKKDTIAPLTKGGYCCGDDGDADLGTVFDTVNVCVKDGTTYQWIKGVNATRYLNKRLLYCEGNFTFCLDEAPYYQLGTPAVDCTNLCNYYCEPRFNTWLSDTAPEGLNILNESIKTGEQIDTEKFDLSGKSGCCPSTWCWNGKQCIENQIDEPLNMYTLKNANGKVNRCQDGAWMIANLSVTWDYKLKGYCPDKDKQCFVGNFSYSGNNKPETYFSDKKPQCIGDGQYILDYYCNANKWQSRTSLVATKMLALAGVENGAKFKIFCDDYSISLNDLNYQIMGKPVLNYLAKNCKLNNRTFNCVNNFCVLKDQTTGNVMLGTSLNVPFENPTNGLANVLGVSGCATPSAHGVWDYGACGANAVYNPTFGLVIFSKTGITTGSSTSSWQLFRDLIKDPIVTLSDLIIRGQIQFQSASGLMIKFNVLNTSKMFSRLYLADFGGGQKVEGIFENSRFDAVSNKPKHYLLIDYQNWNVDICRYVNNYTLALDRRLNCKKNGNNYVVLDEREAPSLLMEHWADLTSKFKP